MDSIFNADGTLNRQEAFNRAWNGLKSQGWTPATTSTFAGPACAYRTPTGLRCAWGWVDPEGTELNGRGTVFDLKKLGVGLAANLNEYDLQFAKELQATHDKVGFQINKVVAGGLTTPEQLQIAMSAFGRACDLAIPGDISV
jgi:hypothetical protein